ncbi:MFS transporter [Paenibacillus taihuensis]|uniref:MFS transporter n=1 Tax=Paenibacillus taihuensis TaxID=1156355 RepID=UPI000E25A6A0
MPTIIRDLHDMTLYGWVAGIYMLSMTACMPIMGKLSDIFGRKRLYLISISLFILGSLGAASPLRWNCCFSAAASKASALAVSCRWPWSSSERPLP